ncbi:MAG: hypothetical protein AB4368_13785 [Xenococcaceae cyanobacterium]
MTIATPTLTTIAKANNEVSKHLFNPNQLNIKYFSSGGYIINDYLTPQELSSILVALNPSE